MPELASQRHAAQPSPQPVAPGGAPAGGEPFLAADVGGTHARVALVLGVADRRHPVQVLHYHRYACGDWAGLGALLRDFVVQLGSTGHAALQAGIRHCVVACAGVVLGDAIVNENLPWPVSIAELRDELGLARLDVINDFEAVAWATRFLDADETLPVIDAAQPAVRGPVLVMGPGTGLGSAVLLPRGDRAEVLPTEAGQISLAPGNEREMEILRVLARGRTHVSYEEALSGPGLLNLYRALCELRGCPVALMTPAEITGAALSGRDAAAEETLQVFCGLLGSFAGDLAMLYGASGGVFLAGGILPQLHDFLRASSFARRFLDKGVMQAFLQKIPVRLIEHGQLGVIGAAGWFLDERQGDRAMPPL
ncbi:MAG: glucokinase [Rhodanobacter sp. 68-29]|nr:glucokinase [Rhodanobacter sp.]ODU73196.1 MAG: glucokinase [Rhodanobacter sp. SCN 69-32]OJY57159.1 MAG: glucokinase [Rhodanobacter sp. 68-29]